jgi:hypothetical protein
MISSQVLLKRPTQDGLDPDKKLYQAEQISLPEAGISQLIRRDEWGGRDCCGYDDADNNGA